ncbi:polysaccharide deacetylase family protein [Salinarchaeum laminariae]|uniref:polysaccharide deacetylase family protein n=1 Tax=Salinarchaeum laminariae TaxID=869888 RepID=UPI0020BD7B6E|nr:polysaccharide deacetylase family protein [Salinarchaeum laminariae]
MSSDASEPAADERLPPETPSKPERRADGRQEPPRPLNEATSRQDVRRYDDRSTGDGLSASDETVASDGTAVSDRDGATGAQQTVDESEVVGRIAEGGPQVGEDLLPDHSFALCLTHDVDRPYKFAQAGFYALRDRDPTQLLDLLPGRRPNWTFDRLLAIEAELGVRSAFYFLDEQRLFGDRPIRDWFDLDAWQLYADRYSLDDPEIVELMERLDRGGWEVGLHGSYESYDDRRRLRAEKRHLESVFGKPVLGGRQHYLNRTLPETWEHHAALGLGYDATVGSSTEIGFDYGDTIGRPFDDEFVAFPLTMMDVAMPNPAENPDAARAACDRILEQAADRGAIATVLWHPRVFNDGDWPGHTELYRYLLERALELGAWVGSPGDLYGELDHPE